MCTKCRIKFNAGTNRKGEIAVKDNENHYRFFERQVAPLLANHCLECHDSSNSKGDLNLSRKVTAFEDDPHLATDALALGRNFKTLSTTNTRVYDWV